MGFSCGIVGLPNAGKSTLLNALTKRRAAQAEAYPFCTIDPNHGEVALADARLRRLAALASSAKIVPTKIAFTDIAGLVAGASKGEGLGNRFLAHIRERDALLHALRCFDDGDVAHVAESVNPARDAEIVETELMLADMESLQKRSAKLEKKARGAGDEAKSAAADKALAEEILSFLDKGDSASVIALLNEEGAAKRRARSWQLLTAKPVLYVANADEEGLRHGSAHIRSARDYAEEKGAAIVLLSARLEEELALFSEKERADYLKSEALAPTGLEELIRQSYALLRLITFFTVGEKEARAWTIPDGTSAMRAAGRIHADFEKHFIRAETVAYQDFLAHQGWHGAREAGRMRLEGKDYIVKDGDVMHIRHAS